MTNWSLWIAIAALGSQNGAVSENRISPPRLPAMSLEDPEYWQTLQPIWFSKEETVFCRSYGQVSAKFQYRSGRVRVIEMKGFSHRISRLESIALNAALTNFGFLDRVSIGCNLRDSAVITLSSRATIVGGKRMVRRLSIVWTQSAMMGTDGRPQPVQEMGEDLYG